MNDYPKTKDEWWEFVDGKWDDLKALVLSYHPSCSDTDNYMPISAKAAEAMCEVVREKIKAEGKQPTTEDDLERMRWERNSDLARIFSRTWFGLPESYEVHSLPAFGTLCDLCSESSVLFEDGE